WLSQPPARGWPPLGARPAPCSSSSGTRPLPLLSRHRIWAAVRACKGGGEAWRRRTAATVRATAAAPRGGIAWGKRTRVVLDVGCGVASIGSYLFDRGVAAVSFAPKDEHEA